MVLTMSFGFRVSGFGALIIRTGLWGSFTGFLKGSIIRDL